MKYIGIDQSIASTGVVSIDNDGEVKCYGFVKNCSKKWPNRFKNSIDIKILQHPKFPKNYSDKELIKYDTYHSLAYIICDDIDVKKGDIVGIEGYSFQSPGNLIDLVTFGTFLRHYCIQKGAILNVFSPSTVKKKFAEIGYGVDDKGKTKNEKGVSGGKFDKHDMFECIMKINDNNEFTKDCIYYKDELRKIKKLPSPIDDIIDAYAIANILKNKNT